MNLLTVEEKESGACTTIDFTRLFNLAKSQSVSQIDMFSWCLKILIDDFAQAASEQGHNKEQVEAMIMESLQGLILGGVE